MILQEISLAICFCSRQTLPEQLFLWFSVLELLALALDKDRKHMEN